MLRSRLISRCILSLKLTIAAFLIATPLLAAAPNIAQAAECAGQKTSIDFGCRADTNPIYAILKAVLRVAFGLIGAVTVGGIVFGGILYSTARGNSGQVERAIGVIRNSVIGLVLYIFMFAILNFLVPGGIT